MQVLTVSSRVALSQTNPSVSYGNSEWLVVWSNDHDNTGAVYGSRVDLAGAVLDPLGIIIAYANGGTNVGVAFDGDNWMIAFRMVLDNGDTSIQTTRVSQSGTIIGGRSLPVSSQSVVGDPTIVFGENCYLVLWVNGPPGQEQIVGRRVSIDGEVLDSHDILICPTSEIQLMPDAAFDGENWLVVWYERPNTTTSRAKIRAARVSQSGVVLDPAGLHIAEIYRDAFAPVVAHGQGEYLIVWSSRESTWVEPSGGMALVVPSGDIVEDYELGRSIRHPAAAFGEEQWLVAYTYSPGWYQDHRLVRLLIDPGGSATDRAGTLDNSYGPLSLDHGQDLWLIAYVMRGEPSAIRAVLINPAGDRVGDPFVVSPPAGSPSSIVHFADRNLEEAVRDALEKPVGDVTAQDMATLDVFGAAARDITDITGLEHAVNITTVDIGANSISDISPLAAMSDLHGATLWQNEISDLTPLANLTNLSGVLLAHNRIMDISPLVGLSEHGALQVVNVQFNYLDLTPGSQAMMDIQTLISRGVRVAYEPQSSPPSDHTVSTPSIPIGPSSGQVGSSLQFSTSGATCSQGHAVQYQFDWGNGSQSSWSASATSSHTYTTANTYQVRARARCSQNTSILSTWSSALGVTISGTPTTNAAPVARASDITGQPQTMYPDTEYTVSAKYFDPDGREDLRYCYLRLDHPTKPLTLMWYQDTRYAPGPWSGEEGADYVTLVNVASTPITEGGLQGYLLAWTFQINDSWPAVEDAINFGVLAADEAGQESGMSYDSSTCSFIQQMPPLDEVELLEQELDKLSSEFRRLTSLVITSQSSAFEAWILFAQQADKSEQELVYGFISSIVSSSLEHLVPLGGIDKVHFKHTGVLSVAQFIKLEQKGSAVYQFLNKIAQLTNTSGGAEELINIAAKASIATVVEALRSVGLTELERGLADYWAAVLAKASNGEQALRQTVSTFRDEGMKIARSAADDLDTSIRSTKAGLSSMSMEQVQGYSEAVRKIVQGMGVLTAFYRDRGDSTRIVWELLDVARKDPGLRAAKIIWGASMGLLKLAATLSPYGALAIPAVSILENLRKHFYVNLDRVGSDAQMAGFAMDAVSDGYFTLQSLQASALGVLQRIQQRGPTCLPEADLEPPNRGIETREIFRYSQSQAFATGLVEHTLDIGINQRRQCGGFTQHVIVHYRLPYTSFRLFPGVTVTHERIIPVLVEGLVFLGRARCTLSHLPKESDSRLLSAILLGKTEAGEVYVLDTLSFEWPTVMDVEYRTVTRGAYFDSVSIGITNGDYSSLSVYYDQQEDRILPMNAMGVLLNPSVKLPTTPKATEESPPRSDVQIAVYDEMGRATGNSGGQAIEEIEASIFSSDHNVVVVFSPSGDYRIEVSGGANASYGMKAVLVTPEGATSFVAVDVAVDVGSRHFCSIDWTLVANGGEGVTVEIDQDGDGVFERVVRVGQEVTGDGLALPPVAPPPPPPPPAGTSAVTHGPNPVPSDGCTFWFELPSGTQTAQLKVFSALGRLMTVIPLDAGSTRYPAAGRWNPVDDQGVALANGPYMYVLLADGKIVGRGKMVIQR